MNLGDRRNLYQKIEAARGRHLIAVCLSSRQGSQAIMAPDMMPSLFRQVRKLPADDKGVDILIESNGGHADVAIRFNDILREAKRDVSVLVPRSAFSAATMLALGGSKIIMHPMSCLGPIDPQLQVRRADGSSEFVGAEDIKAFVEFLNEEAHISDQAQVAAVFARLFDDVRPIQLGVARRASMRSLAIAKELLLRHATSGDAHAKVETIAERLAGGYHAHGHPISPTEAANMGLPVEVATGELASAMWDVVASASAEMEVETPLQPYSHMMQLWNTRLGRWRSELDAQQPPPPPAAGGGPPPGNQPKLVHEVEATKLSFQLPIVFSLGGAIGLVESVRAAARCEVTMHYIGRVAPEGGQLSTGTADSVWKIVD